MTPHSHASGVVKGVRSTPLNKKIPLPPLEVQQAIVAEIEKERALVEGNKTLIALMQEKIRTVIERVWSA